MLEDLQSSLVVQMVGFPNSYAEGVMSPILQMGTEQPREGEMPKCPKLPISDKKSAFSRVCWISLSLSLWYLTDSPNPGPPNGGVTWQTEGSGASVDWYRKELDSQIYQPARMAQRSQEDAESTQMASILERNIPKAGLDSSGHLG
jgi:hypothetical protein